MKRIRGSLGIRGLGALSVLLVSPYVAAQSDEAPVEAAQMGPPSAPAEPPAAPAEPAPDTASASGEKQPTPDWIVRKAKPESPAEYTKPQTSSWRGVFALVFVMVLGGAAIYVKRRRRPALTKQSELEVLHTAKVGPKAQVVVARVAGRRLLLGVTESNVKRLAWLDDESLYATEEAPEAAPEARDELAPVEIPGETNFRGVLKSFLSGRTPSDMREGDAAAAIIARETQDVVYSKVATTLPAPREDRDNEARSKAARREMLRQLLEEEEDEVEGQVAGLLKRRRSA
ncbi:MAG: flagellar biosynthetic protein FliO [Polyangiaceae bacterium]|nr:flagellar biosynthetic protein FliO [Myxococcales bacterium]MCB9587306.1 flagellar biosynthetic protein FliO [Polyangiaceae bacterium]MCB9605897.1 flagellar biosynthetic protein FliO [Polyangiaceae bacterium]